MDPLKTAPVITLKIAPGIILQNLKQISLEISPALFHSWTQGLFKVFFQKILNTIFHGDIAKFLNECFLKMLQRDPFSEDSKIPSEYSPGIFSEIFNRLLKNPA